MLGTFYTGISFSFRYFPRAWFYSVPCTLKAKFKKYCVGAFRENCHFARTNSALIIIRAINWTICCNWGTGRRESQAKALFPAVHIGLRLAANRRQLIREARVC